MRAPMSWLMAAGLLLVGCGSPKEAAVDTRPNWYRDAQPIVANKCSGCHVAGGITPFTLQTYDDFQAHQAEVKAAILTNTMPPWMPSGTCNSYVGDRRLTDAEKSTLLSFFDEGMLTGDAKDQQAIQVKENALPWVDSNLDIGVDYTPNSFNADKTRSDDYRCFLVDPKLTGNTDMIGFQISPDATHEVHHVLIYTVAQAQAQALDDAEDGPGWTCFGGPGVDAASLVGAWAPGMPAIEYPGSTATTLHGGDVLVVQIHYNLLNGAPTPDRTRLALQFARDPITYHAQMFPMVDHDFKIPPHADGYADQASIQLPLDFNLWGLAPHMHMKGQSISVEVAHQDGSSSCLVDIPQWNFNWQQFYFFDNHRGFPIKSGDTVTLKCSWNNPTDDMVRWGENTTDEMCLAFMYLTGPLE